MATRAWRSVSALVVSSLMLVLGAPAVQAGTGPSRGRFPERALAHHLQTRARGAPGAPGAAPVQVPSLWTATSRTFREPDGTYRDMIYAGTVNYRDAAGDFAPIKDRLVPVTMRGYAATNQANAYHVLLPATLG